jgi:hypothetical protein
MTRKDYRVLVQAEGVVLDPAATADQVHAAIAAVDALNDPEQSRAIRDTLTHEAHHRARAPQSDAGDESGSSEG